MSEVDFESQSDSVYESDDQGEYASDSGSDVGSGKYDEMCSSYHIVAIDDNALQMDTSLAIHFIQKSTAERLSLPELDYILKTYLRKILLCIFLIGWIGHLMSYKNYGSANLLRLKKILT